VEFCAEDHWPGRWLVQSTLSPDELFAGHWAVLLAQADRANAQELGQSAMEILKLVELEVTCDEFWTIPCPAENCGISAPVHDMEALQEASIA